LRRSSMLMPMGINMEDLRKRLQPATPVAGRERHDP